MSATENPPPALKTEPPSETPLERILKRIRRTDDFPTVSKHLFEINQKLSANPESSNASDLANLILKDYALTNKLLKLVNSAFYGLAAGNVTTVTRAVVVLGYENIRSAALSLVVFEKFKNKSGALSLKEEVVSSFWSGGLSREIARMNDRINPEEAFVCALMARLGKLALICYLPDEYQKLETWVQENGTSEAKAVKSVCGVTYEELGTALAQLWNFPQQICDAMHQLTENELEDEKNPPPAITALTSFVRELSASIQENGLANCDRAFKELIHRYKSTVKISKRQLKTLVKDSLGRVRKQARAMNIRIDESLFLKQLTSMHRGEKEPPAAADITPQADQQSTSFQLTDDAELKSNMDGQNAQSPKDIILEGIREISETMMAAHDVNDIALMSLEILYRSLKFRRALMFIRNGNSRFMNVRFGYGDNIHKLIRSVRFKIKPEKDLFNFSIQKGKDLIVIDAHDKKISNLIPEWYRTQIDAPAFIFLPVMVQDVCIGAFYADRDANGHPVSTAEHRHLSMLRNQLILAIKYRR